MESQSNQPKDTSVCHACGAKTRQAKFCPECGEPVLALPPACTACGHQPEAKPKFCPECGEKMPTA